MLALKGRNGLYINHFGGKNWYKNGLRHRLNGPAWIFSINNKTHGAKIWFINDKRHRLDGPAVEYNDGRKLWMLNDIVIDCSSQEEFERLIKLQLLW